MCSDAVLSRNMGTVQTPVGLGLVNRRAIFIPADFTQEIDCTLPFDERLARLYAGALEVRTSGVMLWAVS